MGGIILIVEDNAIIAKGGLKTLIESIDSNHEVVTTAYSAQALKFSKKRIV